jgi:hypothetical protein
MKAVVSYITFDGAVYVPFGLCRLMRSWRTDTSTLKRMLSIHRVSQLVNSAFMTKDCRQSFIITQMWEMFNEMYSCPRQNSETKSYVGITSDSVNDSYDENDANGPPYSVEAQTKPTEWQPKRDETHNFAKNLLPETLRIKNLLRTTVRTSCSRRIALKRNWKHEWY